MAGLQDALSLPRLVLASHKSFYRVLEVTKTHAAKAEKHPDLIRQGGYFVTCSGATGTGTGKSDC